MIMAKIIIIPNVRGPSSSMKESESYYLCPTNTVMTGRYHKDDENGQTQYEYATLKAVDEDGNAVVGTITVEDVQWSSSVKESSSAYNAPANRVIVGRQHSGDENGDTQYATAIVKFNGEATVVEEIKSSNAVKESSGTWFKTDSRSVITGRHHNGDENGETIYYSGVIATEPESGLITFNVKGYTTMSEFKSEFVGMYPEGDHYKNGTKLAVVYKLTYSIPNVSKDSIFAIDSPNCGYGSDPVYGGVFWNVSKGYMQSTEKAELVTFCVQLGGKDWYPCKPEDVEWNYIINR